MTPRMIENMREYIEKDDDSNGTKLQFDLLDGWEELTEEIQAKITHVMEQGHVDDEDWKGVSVLPSSKSFKWEFDWEFRGLPVIVCAVD